MSLLIQENQFVNLTKFESLQKTFTAFYRDYCDNKKLTSNVSRSLSWLYDQSTCEVEAHFDKKYSFVMTFLQARIILLFNVKDSYYFQQLVDKLAISFFDSKQDREEIVHTIESLADQSFPLLKFTVNFLKKEPLKDCSQIELNKSFRSQSDTFIKLSSLVSKLKVKYFIKNKNLFSKKKRNIKEIKSILEAWTIKLLKHAKEMLHGDLISSLNRNLTFEIEESELKMIIEGLIEREFIQRSSESHIKYLYLA